MYKPRVVVWMDNMSKTGPLTVAKNSKCTIRLYSVREQIVEVIKVGPGRRIVSRWADLVKELIDFT